MGLIQNLVAAAGKHLPEILAVGAAGGVILTGIEAAREAPKAQERLEEAREEKGEELTLWEKTKAVAPAYAPAIFTGALTIGAIFAGNRISAKKIGLLSAAYITATEDLKNYRAEVVQRHGSREDSEIMMKVMEKRNVDVRESSPKIRVWLPDIYNHEGEIVIPKIAVQCTLAELNEYMYDMNRSFHGYPEPISYNSFLSYFNHPPVKNGDVWGWDQYVGEANYGYTWIDVEYDYSIPGMVSVRFPFPPHSFDMEYEDPDECIGIRRDDDGFIEGVR